jgi:hypothetical protein
MQWIARRLAWWLPKKVAYWAAIRVGAYACGSEYPDTEVPRLTVIEALQRWGPKK